MAKAKPPIKIKIGKGVTCRDGKTPYAAATIHAVSNRGMMYPCVFSHQTVALLLADDSVAEIQVIDENNVKSTITKTWIARVPFSLPALPVPTAPVRRQTRKAA